MRGGQEGVVPDKRQKRPRRGLFWLFWRSASLPPENFSSSSSKAQFWFAASRRQLAADRLALCVPYAAVYAVFTRGVG